MNIDELIKTAHQYKAKTASRYLPITQEEILSKIVDTEGYLVSTKYDGHFYLLHFDGSSVLLMNHSGEVLENLLLLQGVSDQFSDYKSLVVVGELYVAEEGKRTRSFDVSAAVKSEPDKLKFAAFDIVEVNNELVHFDEKELFSELSKIFSDNESSVHAVNNQVVDSRKDIEELYRSQVVEANSEGLVVNSIYGPTYKIKPKLSLDAVILGFNEGEGERKGMIRDLLVGLMVEKDVFQIIGKVGSGFTDEQRKQVLTELEKQTVTSDYIEVSKANTAYLMVTPNKVVELSCLDLITENSKGAINKMSLKFKAGNYISIGKVKSVSVISPVFEGLRTDKLVNEQDVGMTQVTKIVELDPSSNKTARSAAKSELLKREVYVKESKGKKMVRKFVLWKTNKESLGNYPAYVCYTTDYSSTRKEMLKSDIKVSNQLEQIEKMFAIEVVDNIKKGWEKV
jgi:hypothetical protein